MRQKEKMKYFTSVLLSILFSSTCTIAQSHLPTSEKVAIIEFEESHIELGEVKHGESKEMEYVFTNVGKEDLQISFVSSCECTKINYPRKPIAPGETGKLKVTFDSTEKEESETVDIDVYLSNLDPETGDPIWFILDYSFVLIK